VSPERPHPFRPQLAGSTTCTVCRREADASVHDARAIERLESDRRQSRGDDAPGTPWDDPGTPNASEPAAYRPYRPQPPIAPEPVAEYPERCECPHCKRPVRVVVTIATRGYSVLGDSRVLEEHTIWVAQQDFAIRNECTIEYRCPASGAVVSSWRRLR
jgi:hypothetical protein